MMTQALADEQVVCDTCRFIHFGLQKQRLLNFDRILHRNDLQRFIGIFPAQQVIDRRCFAGSGRAREQYKTALVVQQFEQLRLLGREKCVQTRFKTRIGIKQADDKRLLVAEICDGGQPQFNFFAVQPVPDSTGLRFPPFTHIHVRKKFEIRNQPLTLFY